MAFTLICHACGQKLTLFDLDVKKRKGTVRCTRCGARISYDLDKRNIQQSGFWAAEEPAFDRLVQRVMVAPVARSGSGLGPGRCFPVFPKVDTPLRA